MKSGIKKSLFGLFFLMISLLTMAQSKLETVAEFGKHQPIGLGVSRTNRIFVTFPKNSDNYDYGLVEIVKGERLPYPNGEWNQWDSLKPQSRFINVQALFVDQTNSLWVLDPASPSGQKAIPEGIKLVKNQPGNQSGRENLPVRGSTPRAHGTERCAGRFAVSRLRTCQTLGERPLWCWI